METVGSLAESWSPVNRLFSSFVGAMILVHWVWMCVAAIVVACTLWCFSSATIGQTLIIAIVVGSWCGVLLARWRFPNLHARLVRYMHLCRKADILVQNCTLDAEVAWLGKYQVQLLLERQLVLFIATGRRAREGKGLWEENVLAINRKLNELEQLVRQHKN